MPTENCKLNICLFWLVDSTELPTVDGIYHLHVVICIIANFEMPSTTLHTKNLKFQNFYRYF